MTQFQGLVRNFHRKHDLQQGQQIYSSAQALLRERLISEEAAEVIQALHTFTVAPSDASLQNLAKELADLLYVTFGAAVELGIPMNAVFEDVHRSNMTKAPAKDPGGKVTKGPSYRPPDLYYLTLERQS